MQKTFSVIVPVFNEEDCIRDLVQRVLDVEKSLNNISLEILLVNDGSTDKTKFIINEISSANKKVKAVSLSRNFGHQMALTAGLDIADGDYVCVIDADLQDPPELLPEMLNVLLDGNDIVYGKRNIRVGESWFKKTTASMFYRILSLVCRVEIPKDTGDFRIMSRKVVLEFRKMREYHRFVRGMVPWLGFKSAAFHYNRHPRFAGNTKYPFLKMASFAMHALLSFSNLPLRISTYIGFLMTLVSAAGVFLVSYLKLFTTYTVPGISAVLVLVFFTSGVQFIILGIIGEYIGRIFEQSKERPLYIIDKK